jgi:hypothetical protein
MPVPHSHLATKIICGANRDLASPQSVTAPVSDYTLESIMVPTGCLTSGATHPASALSSPPHHLTSYRSIHFLRRLTALPMGHPPRVMTAAALLGDGAIVTASRTVPPCRTMLP